jgi:hypothetical protein
MKHILLILSFISIFSCQSIVEDVPLPKAEVKAVAFGYFDNLNLANKQNITLTKSKPVLNAANEKKAGYDFIMDADVTISGDGVNHEFKYDPVDTTYVPSQQLNFKAGSEYTLTINSPEFGPLKSTQTMPEPVVDYTIKIDSLVGGEKVEYKVSIEFDDNSSHYYRVEAFSVNQIKVLGLSSKQKLFVSKEYFEFSNSGNRKITTSFADYFNEETQSLTTRGVYIVLSSISEDYYNYGKLLNNFDPQNPFAEPVTLPSNIDGGLGMFTLASGLVIPII